MKLYHSSAEELQTLLTALRIKTTLVPRPTKSFRVWILVSISHHAPPQELFSVLQIQQSVPHLVALTFAISTTQTSLLDLYILLFVITPIPKQMATPQEGLP